MADLGRLLGGSVALLAGVGCCLVLAGVLIIALILGLLRRQRSADVSPIPPPPPVQSTVEHPTAASVPSVPSAGAPVSAPPAEAPPSVPPNRSEHDV